MSCRTSIHQQTDPSAPLSFNLLLYVLRILDYLVFDSLSTLSGSILDLWLPEHLCTHTATLLLIQCEACPFYLSCLIRGHLEVWRYGPQYPRSAHFWKPSIGGRYESHLRRQRRRRTLAPQFATSGGCCWPAGLHPSFLRTQYMDREPFQSNAFCCTRTVLIRQFRLCLTQ